MGFERGILGNRYLWAALLAVPAFGCGAIKKAAKDAAGKMEFAGTVNRAGTTTPVSGAQVNLIPLINGEAISQLIEYREIPDGKGGKGKRVRVKLDKIQPFVDSNGDVVKTTTDASGKFKVEAPTNAYLVYTYGPGSKPGAAADSYGVHFWGINPETGELTLDHLIGKDLKPNQANDTIQLAGGPVPPAPPPAATPQALPTPPPPQAPINPPAVQPEPEPTDTLPPGNIIPPPASTTFWKSIKLTFKGGFIGTGGAFETATAELPDDQRYLELSAELGAEQTDPVYLVIQKGFDSTYVKDCGDSAASATTRVYPAAVNGTQVTYQLVPPGPFYKLYLAKKAEQKADGEAPTATDASETLTVGQRDCASATPPRPFMATLSWDRTVDVDLHVRKYDAAKVKAAADADALGEAIVDQANWTRKVGETLSLDVDNVYGYGPENNGEAKEEANPEKYCYLVQLNYYSGSGDVNSNVDVTWLTKDGDKVIVNQANSKVTLKEYGEWKSIGAYGPSECQKLMSPPPSPDEVQTYPALSSCVRNAGCALKGAATGQYKATVTLDKTSFAAGEAVKISYSAMPGLSGDWITIVPKGQEDNSWCSWQWSSGETGTQYYSGMPAGDYEVRMYYNWTGYEGSGGGQCEVIGRQTFTVQ